MSGPAIYRQIEYHKRELSNIEYFYFNGLLLNGNVKELESFCDLILDRGLNIRWAGQAMVRPEMSLSLLKKMRSAGCEWLYFGVESGSDTVLKKMNKNHNSVLAEEVLKNTNIAGIKAQINIMFGFPTETEKDFNETVDFLKRIRPYIDSILASQSFCTLEKETYMRRHPEEFSITNGNHHLFWKSQKGKNNYLERFKRYENFCIEALDLGIPETSGILRKKPDKWLLMGDYCFFENDYDSAIKYYEKSLNEETEDKLIYKKMAEVYEKKGESDLALMNYKKALSFKSGEYEVPKINAEIIEKIELLESK